MKKFIPTKPSALLIGKWQPWHEGHTSLFRQAIESHGQVTIVCQALDPDVDEVVYDFEETAHLIRAILEEEGFTLGSDYIIMQLPRIAEISAGAEPDYNLINYEDVDSISSSQLRKEIKNHELETTNVGQPQEG
jgi:nicotinamide mononucleotide adenylyltransferase